MNDNNFFPWDDISDSDTLPSGNFQMKWVKLEDGQSNSSGKRMFKAQYQVIAPLEYQGQAYFENYVTGSEEAPGAILPGSMGTKSFKRALKAAQIPPANDINVVIRGAINSELVLTINEFVEKAGEYAGQMRNRTVGYWRVGEKQVGLAPAPAQPGQQARPPVMPAMGGVTSGMPQMGGQPMGAGAVPPPVNAPSFPPQGMPGTPPRPPQAPAFPGGQTTQAPVQSAGVLPTPLPVMPSQPTPQLDGPKIRCTLCNRDVPATIFNDHVQRHVREPQWDGVSGDFAGV